MSPPWSTVRATDAVALPDEARSVLLPGESAVTFPSAATVATTVLLEVYEMLPLPPLSVAVSCAVSPGTSNWRSAESVITGPPPPPPPPSVGLPQPSDSASTTTGH